jgi:hypothetical protein
MPIIRKKPYFALIHFATLDDLFAHKKIMEYNKDHFENIDAEISYSHDEFSEKTPIVNIRKF